MSCVSQEIMDDNKKIVLVREFNADKDTEQVGNLERKCEMIKAANSGSLSVFTNMMSKGDPLDRVRLYPLHVMLVAEMRDSKEVVGVVRGCIKNVLTRLSGENLKLGCLLGLRVSPEYRRMGIGFQLVVSVEEWMTKNGADYNFLAIEKNNAASMNLFASKCNYRHLSSLVIYSQSVGCSNPFKKCPCQDIKIEKLTEEQAVSLYNHNLKSKDMYPADIDAILKEDMNLGTWICYFKGEEERFSFDNNVQETLSSWVLFSIWNSCDTRKGEIQIQNGFSINYLHAALSNAREKVFRFLKLPKSLVNQTPGFLFLYGIHGEGERAGELLNFSWASVSRLARTLKGCKAIMTELGVSDPLMKYLVDGEEGVSSVEDLWYVKKVRCCSGEEGEPPMEKLGNVFVDPRDF